MHIDTNLQPAEWDEDAPYEIPDVDATKPDDWLEDEPQTILDPGSSSSNLYACVSYNECAYRRQQTGRVG